jgi:hypothetical protein
MRKLLKEFDNVCEKVVKILFFNKYLPKFSFPGLIYKKITKNLVDY